MNFEKAKEFLQGFVSYEGVAKIPYSDETFNLQKVKDFLRLYDVDYEKLKYVHVAGSKGKGTTCAFIANYLWNDGYKVGLYTSPHIFEVTERIWMNGEAISEERFAEMVGDLKRFVEKNDFFELTYFEILTVLALKYFVEEGVDYVVLEVGLGGRLDATNIVRPVLSVLTTVELEHTDVLGDTIEKILNEKLGIVKDGVPVLIGYQSKEALKIVHEKLKNKKEVYLVNDFEVKFSEKDFFDEARFKNAHVAFVALKLFFGKIVEKKFLEVVSKVRLPGRFDVRKTAKGKVILDMAHTENSIDNLVKSLEKNFPKRRFIFLFALMKGKNVNSILKKVSSVAEKIVFTSAHEVRGILPEELKSIAVKIGVRCELEVMDDCEKAFKMLTKKNQLLVVTGSHFLVGKLLKKKR